MKPFNIVRAHRRPIEELRGKVDRQLAELRKLIADVRVQWDGPACAITGTGSVTRSVLFAPITHVIEISAKLVLDAAQVALTGNASARGPFPGKAEDETVKQLDRIVAGFVA